MRCPVRWTRLLLLFAMGIGADRVAVAQATALQTGRPELVSCEPVTQTPCMAATVVPVDAAGKPAPVALPGAAQLAQSFQMHGADGTAIPFYASAGDGPDLGQHSNVVLLVLDISGSMNQPAPGAASRFEALKSAVTSFIQGMNEGSDRIAIVPFESHNVAATIRSAVFASTRADALAQLRALPSPESRNNTALYQAVFSGVEALQSELGTLQREGHAAQDVQSHLIVMTDGKNEVLPGDDPLLLNGDLGLQQAAAQVQASHLDVIGIGFGDRASIDVSAMQRLSRRFFYATDAAQLLAAMHASQSAVSHAVQLVWLLPVSHRLNLMGRDPQWIPELHLPTGGSLTGAAVRAVMPATAAPVYARHASAPELQALIGTHPSSDSGWAIVVTYAVLALVFAGLLLALWFWVPRLVWGDESAVPAHDRARKWSSEQRTVTTASATQVRSTKLPEAFARPDSGGAPIQRSAAQTTQIQPRGELSRTRLTYE